MRLLILPAARADLREIGDFIASDNPARAATFVAEIEARIGRIAAMPDASLACDDLHPGLRSVRQARYGIFFTVEDDAVRIVRVIHDARDLRVAFRK